jgi:uncharacterized protein
MRERRFFKGAEVRATGDGHIEGHAAVFNQEYVLWDSPTLRVTEIIRSGAFDKTISEKHDVRCLFNHDPNMILGRTASGTLSLAQDTQGLKYNCDVADTSIGRDVRTSIQRGDISGCSFAFIVDEQKRTEEEKEQKLFILREILKIGETFDVGPVTYPAYEGTDVKARSLELRGLFPDGVPDNVKAHAPELDPTRKKRDAQDGDPDPDEVPDGDPDDEGGEKCSCRCARCKRCTGMPDEKKSEEVPSVVRARTATLLAELQ